MDKKSKNNTVKKHIITALWILLVIFDIYIVIGYTKSFIELKNTHFEFDPDVLKDVKVFNLMLK